MPFFVSSGTQIFSFPSRDPFSAEEDYVTGNIFITDETNLVIQDINRIKFGSLPVYCMFHITFYNDVDLQLY